MDPVRLTVSLDEWDNPRKSQAFTAVADDGSEYGFWITSKALEKLTMEREIVNSEDDAARVISEYSKQLLMIVATIITRRHPWPDRFIITGEVI